MLCPHIFIWTCTTYRYLCCSNEFIGIEVYSLRSGVFFQLSQAKLMGERRSVYLLPFTPAGAVFSSMNLPAEPPMSPRQWVSEAKQYALTFVRGECACICDVVFFSCFRLRLRFFSSISAQICACVRCGVFCVVYVCVRACVRFCVFVCLVYGRAC